MTRKRILIVEDTPELRTDLAEQLVDGGYESQAVGSGEEALEAIARSAPDVILLDIGLPGMSGWDFLTRLREDPGHAAIPVVILTGHDATAELIRGYGLGVCYYVTKPWDKHELLRGLQIFAS